MSARVPSNTAKVRLPPVINHSRRLNGCYDDRDREADFRFPAVLRDDDEPVFFRGTLAPLDRASLSPIAIACFRLFTGAPVLLFSVPDLRRCMADFTLFWAAFPYFATLPPFLGWNE